MKIDIQDLNLDKELSTFASIKHIFFSKVLNLLDNSTTSVEYAYSVEEHFKNIVSGFFEKNILIGSGRSSDSFPFLYYTRIRFEEKDNLENSDLFLTSGSSGEYKLIGKDLVNKKAMGEFLERVSTFYPLDLVKKNKFEGSSLKDLLEKKVVWRSLFSGNRKSISLQDCYYGINGKHGFVSSENGMEKTTNGSAGHFDIDKAILSGCLELIQRDGFMLYWLNSITPDLIDIDADLVTKTDKDMRDDTNLLALSSLLKDMKRYDVKYYFLDMTTDIAVPNVCCLVEVDSPTGKRIGVGASCGLDCYGNMLNSLTEALSVLDYFYYKEPFILPENYSPFKNSTVNRDQRLRLYLTDVEFQKLSFLIKGNKSISVKDWKTVFGKVDDGILKGNTKSKVSYLKSLFKDKYKDNKDYDIYFYEYKNALLEKFNYRVVKVFCKALYSLYLNEQFADTNHPRLREFLLNKNLLGKEKLNIWPHPFP